MAFRPLTDAECGQANALNKLTSHITQDQAFASSHGQILSSSSDQLVEQFLHETRTLPQSFRMDDLMREMHEIESQRSALPPVPATTIKDHLHDDAWAQQYLDDGKAFLVGNEPKYDDIWAQISSQEQINKDLQVLEDVWENDVLDGKFGGPSLVQQSARQLRESVHDDKFVYSKFMKFMKNVEEGEVDLEEGKLTEQEAQAWTDEYFSVEGATNEKQAEQIEKLSDDWANEFLKTNDEEFKSSIWNKLQEDIKRATETDEDSAHPWLDDYMNYYNAPQKEYEFSEDNPMLDLPNPIERGKQFLEEGDLPSAVLCFEAAVKQQPENAETWLLLGTTQAENEQDPMAISALNKCIQLEPNNLTALMVLAASYTNESYYNQACHMLMSWLRSNPKYAHLVPPEAQLSGNNQKLIQDLYIKAVQKSPKEIDYEVQSGLGVLCNLTGEYDKAADCFRTALSVRPNDARLWNRLGATLANGNKPEEAVEAYHHALEISPGYIRARYNVGITCINLNAYKEAAEHFLIALNQQARGKDVLKTGGMSQMSDTIWSTLRMCISLMNRGDLKEMVDERNLQVLNKEFNMD